MDTRSTVFHNPKKIVLIVCVFLGLSYAYESESFGNPIDPVKPTRSIMDIAPQYQLNPQECLSYSHIIGSRLITVVFDDNINLARFENMSHTDIASWCFWIFESYWNIFGGFPFPAYQINILHNAGDLASAWADACAISDSQNYPGSLLTILAHEIFHAWAGSSFDEYGYQWFLPNGGDRRIMWVVEGLCQYYSYRESFYRRSVFSRYFKLLEHDFENEYPPIPLNRIEADPKMLDKYAGIPYHKGPAVMYLLDRLLVTQTGGEKNVSSLMKYMYRNFGWNYLNPDALDPDPNVVNPHNQPPFNCRNRDVINALKKMTNHQFDNKLEVFWTKFVEGTEQLPKQDEIIFIDHSQATD